MERLAAASSRRPGSWRATRRLVELFESLTPEQREAVRVDLGFLPAPVPLATPLAMRLNEHTLHGWDARVGLDPAAALSDEAAELVLQHYTDSMSFMLGFIGKADRLDEPVRLGVGDRVIAIEDAVGLEPVGADAATATYDGPLEAVVRLWPDASLPSTRPAEVSVTGNVSLDQLRDVFPGY